MSVKREGNSKVLALHLVVWGMFLFEKKIEREVHFGYLFGAF